MTMIITGNIRTYFFNHGNGYPLVLLHGALMDHCLWNPQINAFAEKYQVIVYDLRGHGQSEKEGDPDYSVELLAHDLLELLNNFGLACVHLCGLGLGGMVAQEFASRYPARVEKLVLCDTAVSATLYWSENLTSLAFDRAFALILRMMGAERDLDFALKLAKLTRGKHWLGETPEVRDYLRTCLRAFDTAEMARIRAMEMRYRGAELSRILAPTLILAGKRGSKNMFRQVKLMSKQIPDNQVQIIPGAGRLSNMENPQIFNNLVLDFLA